MPHPLLSTRETERNDSDDDDNDACHGSCHLWNLALD